MLSFILRTFALSISIFWRALPCWALLFGVLYVLADFFSSSLIIFAILLMAAGGTLMVYMIFVHIRSGLIVADVVTPTDIGALFKRSFKFFRFFAMFNALVSGLSVVAFVIAGRLGIFDLDAVVTAAKSGTPEDIEMLTELISRPSVYAYITITQILSQLAYASLAVPMAANAAACSPKARDYEVFWGFGAYTMRMFLLNLISGTIVTGFVLVYVFVFLTMPLFDGQSLLQLGDAADISAPNSVASYLMIAALVLLPVAGFVWMVSLWCAGATLCFLDHRARTQVVNDFDIARVFERPYSGEELRALRVSRMHGVHAH
jgi:hypothetical protein